MTTSTTDVPPRRLPGGGPEARRRETVAMFARTHPWGVALLAQVAVACVLCLYSLGHKSFWMDEGFSFVAGHRSWGSLGALLTHDESNMGPYYVGMHLWTHLGRSEATLRLPSVLFAVATVPLLATVVDRTYGRRAGLAAGLLLAVNAMVVVFAQEARAYSMVMCGATASIALFLELVLRPRRAVAWAYVLVTSLAVYAHYFAALVVAAQLCSLLWLPDARVALRRLRGPLVGVAVLVAPLVPFVVGHRSTTQVDWIPPFSGHSLPDLVRHFVGDYSALGLRAITFVAFVVLAAVWTLRRRDRTRRSEQQWSRMLIWCWLVVPLLLTVAACLVENLWVARYLIVVLPAFVGLVAVGATRLRATAAQGAAVVLLLVLSGVALKGYYPPEQHWGEDWRGASLYLASPGVQGRAVVFAPSFGRNAVDYYRWARGLPPVNDARLAPGDAFHGVLRARNVSGATTIRRLEASPGGVAYLVQDGVVPPEVERDITAAGYRRGGSAHFGQVTVTRLLSTR